MCSWSDRTKILFKLFFAAINLYLTNREGAKNAKEEEEEEEETNKIGS